MSFGLEGFGTDTFGRANWGKKVTWEALPQIYRNKDDGSLEKFTGAIEDLFNEIKRYTDLYLNLFDPRQIRKDLLETLASNFGITKETRWSDDFLMYFIEAISTIVRMKGRTKSIEVILRIAGFNATVEDLYEVEVKASDPDEYFLLRYGDDKAIYGENKLLEETITYQYGLGDWKNRTDAEEWANSFATPRNFYPLPYIRIKIDEYPGKRNEFTVKDVDMILRLVKLVKPCTAKVIFLICNIVFDDMLTIGDSVIIEEV